MADFTPALKKLLRQHGCYFVRIGKGDHEIWFSPLSQQHFTVDGSIKSRHTANAVLKQAGLPKNFRVPKNKTATDSRLSPFCFHHSRSGF